MPEITVRRRGELLRGIFQILRDSPEGLPAFVVLDRLEKLVPPTQFEATDYPNRPGVRRYDRTVRFHTIQPVKAGWMTKSDGIWSLTDAGRVAFDTYTDPVAFSHGAREGYRRWEREHESSGRARPPADEPIDEPPAEFGALEEAEERAAIEIRARILEMDPYDFQELVAGLTEGMGHHVHWVAPPGKDGGMDAIVYSDGLGITGPTIRVSARTEAKAQSVDDVRSFLATLHGDDVGLFFSTGGFTRDAEGLARSDPRKIRLINLEKLVELWKQYYPNIPEARRALLPLKPVYFLLPKEGD